MIQRAARTVATIAAIAMMASCSAPQNVDDTGTATGSGSEPAGTEPAASSGQFVYGISGDPTSTNPLNVSDRWGLTVTNIVYSPLAHLDDEGNMVNDLAEDITQSEDGMEITVTLREGLQWSDGEPLTAADVVFTYTEKAKKENGNADALWIGDQPVTATEVDERTVRFDLPAYSSSALSQLAFETYIIPEHVYGDGQDLSGQSLEPAAVGSGPYKLVEYQHGQFLQFEANEHFNGEAPKIDDLTLRIVENADTVKAALQSGELDASFVTPQQAPDLESAPVEITAYPEGRLAYLGALSEKITDVRVRQAIFFALNRDDILKATWLDEEYYEPAHSFLPPSNPFATEDVEDYAQDVDKAKQLLAEAGAEGLEVTLAYVGNDPAQTTQATLIQQMLGQVGVKVQLQGLDGTALYTELAKGAEAPMDLYLGGYIMGHEPAGYDVLFRSDGYANDFGLASDDVDRLFDEATASKDEAEREDLYAQVQAAIADEAVLYPIGDNLKLIAVNERIGGVEDAQPVPIYTFHNFGALFEQ